MAVKGSATVTLTSYRDTQSVTRYYKLQTTGSSAPSKPTTKPPSSDWTDSEPDCDISKELYFCDLTIFSNGEWEYSSVSKSSSYEAAKEAYNKAQNAQDGIDNLEIGGKNILLRTKDFSSEKWYIKGISTPVLDDDGFYYCGILNTWNNYIYQSVLLELNEVYTCSFYAKADSAVQLEIKDDGTNNQVLKNIPITSTEWQRYTFTFTRYVNESTTSKVTFLTRQANTTIYIKKIKIEKGDKATDWTPAPEDVDAGIANAAKVATNYIHADSTNGLVVNNNQTVGVGYDVQLKADGSNTGMNIRQDGSILASFLQNHVSLGKNSINSKVAMCGDKGGVSASFGYYVDSVISNNVDPGSTLDFDFNETTFKNKVGQKVGYYEFIYTSVDGWELFDYEQDTTSKVTLSQYGITMKTSASSIKDYAGITINYVLDGSVKFYNADISNPVRKLELEMAENPSSSESDYANITIERQSGTYASGDGKEHSIISMITLHEWANSATFQMFDDEISIDATRLYLTSSNGDGSIELNGNVYVNGGLLVGVETRTLLWTNASPTSAFAAQTISLDLSGYDAVEIVCRYSTTDDTRTRYICDVGSSTPMYWFYYTATDGKYTGVRSRNTVSVSTTGVAIRTCSGKPGNSTTNTTNNGYIIPVEIYGIKGV